MNTLIIGDGSPRFAEFSSSKDSQAVLCTSGNIKDVIEGDQTRYTSLRDVSISELDELVDAANEIIFFKDGVYTDIEKFRIGSVLVLYRDSKRIVDFVFSTLQSSKLSDYRRSTKPQIWVAGCSISHGIGVEENERWGHIVGKSLGMPVSFLTHGGSSIEWAADQILRSDINPQDIVLWGITNTARFLHYSESGLPEHIYQNFFNNRPGTKTLNLDMIVDQSLIFKSINHVLQVANFSKKAGAKFACGILLPPSTGNLETLLYGLSSIELLFVDRNLQSSGGLKFVDIGKDGLHPGPLQHQSYANDFLKLIESVK